MNYKQLTRFINTGPLQDIKNSGKHKYYLSYPIPKSNGGRRWLDAPQDELKEIQNQILHNILYNFDTHTAAIGFRPGVSLISGPKRHLGAKVLLSLDFIDFFDNIKVDKVFEFTAWMADFLQTQGLSGHWHKDEKNTFTELVTYKKHLPQGAPTSPTLSNLICYKLDKELQEIANSLDLTYTRYADDLSFSSEDEDLDIMKAYPEIENAVESFGLKLNKQKTRIKRQHQRMVVTGVVINDRLSVPKYKWRNFRAKLHNLKMSQEPIGQLQYQQILGYAQWIKQLHHKRGSKFLSEIGKLNLQI